MASLRALVLACSLRPSSSSERSSSELLGVQLLDAMRGAASETGDELTGSVVRVADENVRFGVSTDEGDGDGWPVIRSMLLESDLLVIATPIWMGQVASMCKVVLERLDAEVSETDDEGRMLTHGKVASVAVVGNEDGAHHVTAQVLQALNDTGFSVPANASTYWVGEAMQAVDYLDHDETPEKTAATTSMAARYAVHLAKLLKANPFPPAD